MQKHELHRCTYRRLFNSLLFFFSYTCVTVCVWVDGNTLRSGGLSIKIALYWAWDKHDQRLVRMQCINEAWESAVRDVSLFCWWRSSAPQYNVHKCKWCNSQWCFPNLCINLTQYIYTLLNTPLEPAYITNRIYSTILCQIIHLFTWRQCLKWAGMQYQYFSIFILGIPPVFPAYQHFWHFTCTEACRTLPSSGTLFELSIGSTGTFIFPLQALPGSV